MLSDQILDDSEFKSRFASQLKKLEIISSHMSKLVDNGNVERIVHLDKLRKKILLDLNKKQIKKTPINQERINKIISLNDYVVKRLNEQKKAKLEKMKKQSESIKSYIKFL